MVIGIDASRANVEHCTGVEKYTYEVLKRLPHLELGIHFRYYVRERAHPRWAGLPANVEIRILRWPPGLLWTHLRLGWELFWHRPTAVFFPATAISWSVPVMAMTTIHDVSFERYPEVYKKKPIFPGFLGRILPNEYTYQHWALRHAIRKAKRIFTVSHYTKEEISRGGGLGPTDITVTPLGVDQPEVYDRIDKESAIAVRQKFGVHRPYFLFLGRLETKKNIELVLTTYQRYRERTSTPLDLVLVGLSGNGWEPAKQLVSPDLFVDSIHHIGWVDQEDKMILQKEATALFAIPKDEGFGLTALESISAGVPVLASSIGAFKEVLGEAALYVDTFDTETIVRGLKEISENPDLRSTLIQRGRQRAMEFTWDNTAKMTMEAMKCTVLEIHG